jgi:hypothetical protein
VGSSGEWARRDVCGRDAKALNTMNCKLMVAPRSLPGAFNINIVR